MTHAGFTRSRFGTGIAERRLLWAPLYAAVLNILGSTGSIIPIGDTHDEAGDATSVTTRGEEQVVFTYSEARTAFDTPATLLGPARIPIVAFNGTDEEGDTPDAAYWSRDDGAGEGFSVGAWVRFADLTNRPILSKYTNAAAGEWLFYSSSSDVLTLLLSDASAGVTPRMDLDSALSVDAWYFVVATYDGGGGATAADGITIYVDAATPAQTAVNDGSYVAMEDTSVVTRLGEFSTTVFMSGEMAGGPLGPFFVQTELTADQVRSLYNLGRNALNV